MDPERDYQKNNTNIHGFKMRMIFAHGSGVRKSKAHGTEMNDILPYGSGTRDQEQAIRLHEKNF